MTSARSLKDRAYETSYNRDFPLKRYSSLTVNESWGTPRKLYLGRPYTLDGPIGVTSYSTHFTRFPHDFISMSKPKMTQQMYLYDDEEDGYFTDVPSPSPTKMANVFRNQLYSTYQRDFVPVRSNLPMLVGYCEPSNSSRHKLNHTLDSEYRAAYEYKLPKLKGNRRFRPDKQQRTFGIVPVTLSIWDQTPTSTTYKTEISSKGPTHLAIENFLDSLDQCH